MTCYCKPVGQLLDLKSIGDPLCVWLDRPGGLPDRIETHGLCVPIKLRSARSTHHLEYISDRVIDVALGLRVKKLGAFDNNKVRRQVYTPRQRTGRY